MMPSMTTYEIAKSAVRKLKAAIIMMLRVATKVVRGVRSGASDGIAVKFKPEMGFYGPR